LSRLSFSDYDYIPGVENDFECSPEPMRKTKSGYYVRCVLSDENSIPKSKLTFESPIVIELDYGYKTTISNVIEIMGEDPGFI